MSRTFARTNFQKIKIKSNKLKLKATVNFNYKGKNTGGYWSPYLNGVYLKTLINRTLRSHIMLPG